jgi:branched-chain amino acid transport system permease protein
MLDAYVITILTLMGIWSIVTLGLNVITGFAGQFNLGIGVYMGISAILTTGYGLDFWEALPLAVAGAGFIGFLTGLPALRVREDSLAVLTIGLVFVFESLLIYLPYFGGPLGISRIPRVSIGGVPISNQAYMFVVAGAMMLTICICLYLRRSWMGLAWESIRENELAAQVIGINPARFKLYAFVIGAAIAGLGGGLYAHFIRIVTPYDFGFVPSIYVLTMLVFGGIGTIRGAIFGACFLTLLPEMFRFVQDYRNLIYGGALVLLMLYQPRGVLGSGSFVWTRLRCIFMRLRSPRTESRPYAPNP